MKFEDAIKILKGEARIVRKFKLADGTEVEEELCLTQNGLYTLYSERLVFPTTVSFEDVMADDWEQVVPKRER